MSRNYRGSSFVPRWNKTTLTKSRKQNKEGKLAYFNRMIKRMNAAAGYSQSTYEWHFQDGDEDGSQTGTVIARNRSEARAKIKKEMNIPKSKRVPKSVFIQKGDLCQT